MDAIQPPNENYANPRTCFFHILFKGGALTFYILSALFLNNFVIIFVVTIFLSATLDFWVVKNVSGRILVGLRWWSEINDPGESEGKFESLDQEAVAWVVLGIFSLIRFQADYLLVVAVCLSHNFANIVGFTKRQKDAKIQFQHFATQTLASQVSLTIRSTFTVVELEAGFGFWASDFTYEC